jgi:hypothetical protein
MTELATTEDPISRNVCEAAIASSDQDCSVVLELTL